MIWVLIVLNLLLVLALIGVIGSVRSRTYPEPMMERGTLTVNFQSLSGFTLAPREEARPDEVEEMCRADAEVQDWLQESDICRNGPVLIRVGRALSG